MGKIEVSVRDISREIEYYGTTVTLKKITDDSYSKWGDASETITTSTKTAFVQVLTQEDELVKSSTFQSGDKLFWLKGDETDISRGNRITHGTKDYEVSEVIEHDMFGTTMVLEVRTQKI